MIDIDSMPAGPEMDAAVGVVVMRRSTGVINGVCRMARFDGAAEVGSRSFWEDSEPWQPSTNIAHAWEVVEKLIERGYQVIVSSQSEREWGCDVVRWDRRALASQENELTAPLAICRAALKARKP